MIGRPSVMTAIADAVQGFNRLGCKDPEARRLAEDAAKELYAEGKSITGEAVFELGLRARGRAYKMKPLAAAHSAPNANGAAANAEVAHVCQSAVRPQRATNVRDLIDDAISGLRNLGYRESDARAYVELALSSVAGMSSVEELVVAALRMRGQALLAREGTGGGESTTVADPVEYRASRARERVEVK